MSTLTCAGSWRIQASISYNAVIAHCWAPWLVPLSCDNKKDNNMSQSHFYIANSVNYRHQLSNRSQVWGIVKISVKSLAAAGSGCTYSCAGLPTLGSLQLSSPHWWQDCLFDSFVCLCWSCHSSVCDHGCNNLGFSDCKCIKSGFLLFKFHLSHTQSYTLQHAVTCLLQFLTR